MRDRSRFEPISADTGIVQHRDVGRSPICELELYLFSYVTMIPRPTFVLAKHSQLHEADIHDAVGFWPRIDHLPYDKRSEMLNSYQKQKRKVLPGIEPGLVGYP